MKRSIFAIMIIGTLLLSSFLTSPVFSVSNESSDYIGEKEASIDIEKYVWDPLYEEWVDADDIESAVDLPIDSTAEFKIAIHNDGTYYNLTEINVIDLMEDSSLEFVDADPQPDYIEYKEPYYFLRWIFPGPIESFDWINITVYATVLESQDSANFNYVEVTAFYEETIGYVSDEDYAYIYANPDYNYPPYVPSDPVPDDLEIDVDIDTVLSWTGGDPNENDTVTYDVYFGTDNPPSKVEDSQSATTYDPGKLEYGTTYYWQIVAWDNHGVSTEGPVWSFTIEGLPPVANFNYSVNDLTVTFDASESYDPNGNVVNYTWDLGDGNSSYGEVIEHTYGEEKVYTVVLTVTDNDGKTGSISKDVDVTNTMPVANFTYAIDGKIVEFDASSSFDENGTIVSYYWDFGDGTNETGVNPKHEYVKDYTTYGITLTVTDSAGASANVSKNITINDVTDPIVRIVQPIKGLYIRDKFVIPRIRIPLIIGDLTIIVNATDGDGSGIKQVNFFIDSSRPFAKQVGNDTTAPYTYTWTKNVIFRFLHIHKIEVEVFDNAGNMAKTTMIVRRFF